MAVKIPDKNTGKAKQDVNARPNSAQINRVAHPGGTRPIAPQNTNRVPIARNKAARKRMSNLTKVLIGGGVTGVATWSAMGHLTELDIITGLFF